MKVDMTNWSAEEIISHLEIYGDENNGAIIKVIETLRDKNNDLESEIEEFESGCEEIGRLEDILKDIADLARG